VWAVAGSCLTIGSVADKLILLLGCPCWHPWQYGIFPALARIRFTDLTVRINGAPHGLAGISGHPLRVQLCGRDRTGCGLGQVTTGFGRRERAESVARRGIAYLQVCKNRQYPPVVFGCRLQL
jgi:hypothetical protein